MKWFTLYFVSADDGRESYQTVMEDRSFWFLPGSSLKAFCWTFSLAHPKPFLRRAICNESSPKRQEGWRFSTFPAQLFLAETFVRSDQLTGVSCGEFGCTLLKVLGRPQRRASTRTFRRPSLKVLRSFLWAPNAINLKREVPCGGALLQQAASNPAHLVLLEPFCQVAVAN